VAVSVRNAAPPWAYRGLIWNFAVRDVKSRFKGTLLGWVWSLLVPLATVVIYSVVFSAIFRAAPPDFGNGKPGNYAVFLLSGLVVWTGFATNLNVGIGTLLAAGPLLQKIYFPSYAPIIGSVIATFMQTAIEFAILAVILVVVGNVSLAWLWLVPWVIVFVLFVGAVTYVMGALNVFYRDLAYLVAVALQLLFFLTPVIYPITSVPEESHGIPVRAIVEASPLAEFVESFKSIVYGLQVPGPRAWFALAAWCAAALGLAVLTYVRRGQDIGEHV
jgi:ABC-type polysaccharide/polyol phosphate export permease